MSATLAIGVYGAAEPVSVVEAESVEAAKAVADVVLTALSDTGQDYAEVYAGGVLACSTDSPNPATVWTREHNGAELLIGRTGRFHVVALLAEPYSGRPLVSRAGVAATEDERERLIAGLA